MSASKCYESMLSWLCVAGLWAGFRSYAARPLASCTRLCLTHARNRDQEKSDAHLHEHLSS